MTSASPAVKSKNTKAPVISQSLPPLPPARDVAWIEVRSGDGHSQFFTTTCHPLVFMDAVKTDFLQYLTMQRQQQLANIRQSVIDVHIVGVEREGGIDTELIAKLAASESVCMNDTQWLAKAEEYEWDLFDSHTRECISILQHKAEDGQPSQTVQEIVRGGFTYELFTKETSESEFHPLPLSSAQT